jgi:hypothetical protein
MTEENEEPVVDPRVRKIIQDHKGYTIEEMVRTISQDTGLRIDQSTRQLYLLAQLEEVRLRDNEPPSSIFSYGFSIYSIRFWTILTTLLATFLIIYVAPQMQPFSWIRIGLGFIVVLFLPGSALIEALYPKKDDLEELERFALSVGLSLALSPLVGFVLNYTPWGIRLDPIILALSLLIFLLETTAVYQKYQYFKMNLELLEGR